MNNPNKIPMLPLGQEIETKAVLKKLNAVRTALAGLNGVEQKVF